PNIQIWCFANRSDRLRNHSQGPPRRGGDLQMGQRPGRDLTLKQEMNRGFGDALATAFELALTPVIMGLIGWQLDRWLRTRAGLPLVPVGLHAGLRVCELYER